MTLLRNQKPVHQLELKTLQLPVILDGFFARHRMTGTVEIIEDGQSRLTAAVAGRDRRIEGEELVELRSARQ